MAAPANHNHQIKFEVQKDQRITNHLQAEVKDQMNLLFYDFNSQQPHNRNPAASPYTNLIQEQ